MTIFTTKRTIIIFLVCFLGVFLIAAGLVTGMFSFVGGISNLLPVLTEEDFSEVQNNESEAGHKDGAKTTEKEENGGLVALIEDSDNTGTTPQDAFFVNYRLERERVRAQQVEMLNSVVADPNSDAAVRKDAQEKLMDISENMERELQLENLIMAKGYKEAAMFIQSGSATAILEKKGLMEEDVAVIADIISRVTGYNLEDIVVIPK